MQLLQILGGLILLGASSTSCSLPDTGSRIFHTVEKINPSDINLRISLTDANSVYLVSEKLSTYSAVRQTRFGQLFSYHNDHRSGLFCLNIDQTGRLNYFKPISGEPSFSSCGCPLILGLHPKTQDTGSAYEWLITTGFFVKDQALEQWVLARSDLDEFAAVTLQHKVPIIYGDRFRKRDCWSFGRRSSATPPQSSSGQRAKL